MGKRSVFGVWSMKLRADYRLREFKQPNPKDEHFSLHGYGLTGSIAGLAIAAFGFQEKGVSKRAMIHLWNDKDYWD